MPRSRRMAESDMSRKAFASDQSAVAHMSQARRLLATAGIMASPDAAAEHAARSQAMAIGSGWPRAWAASWAVLQEIVSMANASSRSRPPASGAGRRRTPVPGRTVEALARSTRQMCANRFRLPWSREAVPSSPSDGSAGPRPTRRSRLPDHAPRARSRPWRPALGYAARRRRGPPAPSADEGTGVAPFVPPSRPRAACVDAGTTAAACRRKRQPRAGHRETARGPSGGRTARGVPRLTRGSAWRGDCSGIGHRKAFSRAHPPKSGYNFRSGAQWELLDHHWRSDRFHTLRGISSSCVERCVLWPLTSARPR